MLNMVKTYVNSLRYREDGATATEYIILLVFIALAIFVGAYMLGGGLDQLFQSSCEELVSQAGDAPGVVDASCDGPNGGGEGE